MAHKARTLFNTILTAILGLLGLNGCIYNKYGIPAAMYGVPTNLLNASGEVVDEAGQPLEGIGIGVIGEFNEEFYPITTTASDGKFAFSEDVFYMGDSLRIVASDIDSTQNGSYQNDTILVNPQFEWVDSWNSEATISEIKLTMKQNPATDEPGSDE